MANPFRSIADWCGRNKKEKWFKPLVIIVVLTIIAFGVDRWRKYEDAKEMPAQSQTEQAEESLLLEIWDDSKLHLVVFMSLSAVLIAVRHSKNKLKQTGGKEEKGSVLRNGGRINGSTRHSDMVCL